MPGVSTILKSSDFPLLSIFTSSFICISLVSWGFLLTTPRSSQSQSWHILFARVVFPPLGGPYKPSLTLLFFLKRFLKNLLMIFFSPFNIQSPALEYFIPYLVYKIFYFIMVIL